MKQSHYFQDYVLFEQAAGAAIRAGDLEGASYLFRQAANAASLATEYIRAAYLFMLGGIAAFCNEDKKKSKYLLEQATDAASLAEEHHNTEDESPLSYTNLFEQQANAASLATEYTRATYLLMRASNQANDYGDEQWSINLYDQAVQAASLAGYPYDAACILAQAAHMQQQCGQTIELYDLAADALIMEEEGNQKATIYFTSGAVLADNVMHPIIAKWFYQILEKKGKLTPVMFLKTLKTMEFGTFSNRPQSYIEKLLKRLSDTDNKKLEEERLCCKKVGSSSSDGKCTVSIEDCIKWSADNFNAEYMIAVLKTNNDFVLTDKFTCNANPTEENLQQQGVEGSELAQERYSQSAHCHANW